jgi:hypothetical protein
MNHNIIYNIVCLTCTSDIIAVFKTLGTAATMQFFVHMPTPKVFVLFLDTISMDPLEPLAKSDLFHHLQV